MRCPSIFFAVLAVLFAAAVAGAGEMVVIDSDAPGLMPGEILDGSKPLEIAPGTAVTVVAGDGRVKSLKGPFSGVPFAGEESAPGGSALIRSLSRLIGGKSPKTGELGMMRGERLVGRPDAWSIDIIRSGAHCVTDRSHAVLWRPSGVTAETVTIRRQPWGEKVSVDWPAGTNSLIWPKDLPLENGGQYLVRLSSRISGTKMVVYVVPANLPTDAHLAAWMADLGCNEQALALVAEMQ
jgi:hypothetical protein